MQLNLRPALLGIIILSATVWLMYHDGLFTRYNYMTAQWDKYQGRTSLVAYGERLRMELQLKMIALAKDFQIKTIADCNISTAAVRGAQAYNNVMMQALSKKPGAGWKAAFDKSADSLYRLQSSEVVYRAVMKHPGVVQDIARLDSVLGRGKSGIMVSNLYNDSVRKAYTVYPYGQGRHHIYKKYSVNIYTLKVSEYIN
ncbi:hypothetical protein [Mucilaginibacter sp. CSA2-8R]|uniref:hypothetical protein n=1 Tax=Mucilaginibacter sp. CSA2-8R TaxID=3141542 RepID=UPI00315C8988